MTDTIQATLSASILTTDLGASRPKSTAITPHLVEADAELWAGKGSGAEVGIWECSPGSFTARRDGYTEICHIVAGRFALETPGTDVLEVGPGDTIVMPSGWHGIWHVHEAVRKLYIIVND